MVDLLEHRLGRHVVDVVLVRRPARPVASRASGPRRRAGDRPGKSGAMMWPICARRRARRRGPRPGRRRPDRRAGRDTCRPRRRGRDRDGRDRPPFRLATATVAAGRAGRTPRAGPRRRSPDRSRSERAPVDSDLERPRPPSRTHDRVSWPAADLRRPLARQDRRPERQVPPAGRHGSTETQPTRPGRRRSRSGGRSLGSAPVETRSRHVRRGRPGSGPARRPPGGAARGTSR